MGQIGPTMDQKWLKMAKMCVFVPNISEFFVEYSLSEEIILNEVSLGVSPSINFACGQSPKYINATYARL